MLKVQYAGQSRNLVDVQRALRVGEDNALERPVRRGTWDQVPQISAEGLRSRYCSTLDAGGYRHHMSELSLAISPLGHS